MSSAPSVPRGRQEPRLSSVPPYDYSDGDLAIAYAASIGLRLDPWQQYVMVHALGRRGGTFAAFEVDVTVGRQNGKGALLEARELAGIELFGNKLIVHTAHLLKTSEEARLRMEQMCEASPDLDRRVKRVVRTNGKEAIEFWNERRTGVGARILYAARTKGSGRGFAGADLVVMDEKMILLAEPMAALLPTLATSPDPQVWYMGSAHFEDSEQQILLRKRMLAGGDPELAAFEWSVEDGADLDDPEAYEVANPALGYRITMQFLRRERLALGDEEFAREHLGIGGAAKVPAVIDAKTWARLADAKSEMTDPVAFAVEVSWDRTHTSISAAGHRKDGRAHLELVDRRPGTSWAVDRLVELDKRWKPKAIVVDPGSPAGALITGLQEAGIEPLLVTGREFAQACGWVYDCAQPKEDLIRHRGQSELAAAVDTARKRPLGDLWAWDRRAVSEVDVSPLVAATLALFGVGKPSKRRRKTGKAAFV
jgi:hypothetical protein